MLAQEEQIALLDEEIWKEKHFLELLSESGAIAEVFAEKVRLRLNRMEEVLRLARS